MKSPRHGHTDLPDDVVNYINGIPATHRSLFDQLHQLALEAITDVRVVYSYKMPAYLGPRGRISLSHGDKGVSIATRNPEPIAHFHQKHPEFSVGKVTVRFQPDDRVPLDDVMELIRSETN